MTDDFYVYDSNESDTTYESSDDSKLTHHPDVITASYIGVLVLLGLMTNGVVCYVYLRLMTGSVITRPFQPFIVTMSSADLICCLFGFPIDMFLLLTPWAPSHLRLWVFSSVIISVCITLDVLMLVALNTIRYFSVMYPSMTIGRKAVITTLVATLMMSCVVNAPFTFMYGVIMINLKDDYIILCESPAVVDSMYFTTHLVLYLIVMTYLLQQDIQLAWYISKLTQNGGLVTVMSRRRAVSGISHTYIFGSVRRGAYLRNKKKKNKDAYRVRSRKRFPGVGRYEQKPRGETTIPISKTPPSTSKVDSKNRKTVEFQNKIVVRPAPSTARSLHSFQQMWEKRKHSTNQLSVLELPESRNSPFRVLRKNVKVKIKDRTLLSLGITTALFFVSYTPFLVLLAMCYNRVFIPTNRLELSAVGVLQRSTYVLTALNAIIYNLFNEGFWYRVQLYRKRFLQWLCCKG
ncbi:uncharacterized protein LOC112562660 isoform X2 [Pomacea canaliculata]|uniref:uncharacterized protein LOC112562660 isoform X2 n=1 Tax=Pomacea canaliculata TaxID=400727 RepID=UPI000D733F8B|nr:uncharacterized protein LOC112562660 isoform X2 [Pomacea canaliculata]